MSSSLFGSSDNNFFEAFEEANKWLLWIILSLDNNLAKASTETVWTVLSKKLSSSFSVFLSSRTKLALINADIGMYYVLGDGDNDKVKNILEASGFKSLENER